MDKMGNLDLPSLIILPGPPSPITPVALKAAYQPTLTATLITLASIKASSPSVLQVYIPCPRRYDVDEPRSQLFNEVEHLLSGIYSLICAVSAHNAIEPDGSGGVDVRIILLQDENIKDSHGSHTLSLSLFSVTGPIIDLQTLALTRRKWNYIFSVEGERSQETLNKYLESVAHLGATVHGEVRNVPGGITFVSSITLKNRSTTQRSLVHAAVAVGGTFDHLHAGHKLLLTATALLLQPLMASESNERRLVIGITGDQMLRNKKYAEYLQSWHQRQEDVVDFLTTILFFAQPERQDVETLSIDKPVVNGKAIHTKLKQAKFTIECIEIQDAFGPTITDENVSALVVSGETRSGGAAVNVKRKEKGWELLEIFEVDVLDALEDKTSITETEEFAAKISSTEIRRRKAESANKPSL